MKTKTVFNVLVIVSWFMLIACQSRITLGASEKTPTWRIPSDAEIKQSLNRWLEERKVSVEVRRKVDRLWSIDVDSGDKRGDLDSVAATILLADRRAESLIVSCRRGATPETVALGTWLEGEQIAPLVRNNLRLLLGRSLAQAQYFDEAQQQLEDLGPDDVLDPTALLFYQGVLHHHSIETKKGLFQLNRLLEHESDLPERYRVLARLMRRDLMQLKDGSLDDISRRMKDIKQRLSHGQAGERVQENEDEVIRMLDTLIKEEEKKQSQSSEVAFGGGQSPAPMQESLPAGGKGRGEVQKRDLGKSANWGDLPPKEREEAMQQISRDFPAHYREVIEEYFRELAKERK